MKSWLVIIVGLMGSWHYTDLESGSGFQGVFCPIMAGLFLIVLLVKIIALPGPAGNSRGGDGGGFMGDGSGGDG
jgi:hypothetical protein